MAEDAQFQAHTGESLYARRWPVAAARGAVVIVHGYGEHCGRYDAVAASLNALGLSVYSYDQRGHGRSPGKRGRIRRFELLVQDLRAYLNHLGPELSGRPLFLLGHSMGGLVLAHCVLREQPQVAGLIFSSPLLRLNDDVSPLLLRLSRVLSALTPWLPVAQVDPDYLSRDISVVSTYRADPFVYHGKINARTGAELNEAIQAAQRRLHEVTGPLYLLHGKADRLVNPEGTRDLHEKAAGEKTLRLYEGGYHEQFNDVEREQVLAELGEWLEARLAS